MAEVTPTSSPDSVSTNGAYLMTLEQKNWLMVMIDHDQNTMTRLLRDNPELANWKNFIDGNTALHYAAKFGDVALMRMLLGNYQVNVNAQNHDGLTPLHYAAMCGNEETIFALTSAYQANTAIQDYCGQYPVDYLPKTEAGQKLKRFLPNLLQKILKNRSSLLHLLAKNATLGNNLLSVPKSQSENSDATQAHDSHLLGQFPWQQKGHQSASRSPSRKKHKEYKSAHNPHKRGSFTSEINNNYASESLKSRKRGSDVGICDIQLIRDIHESVRRQKDSKTPLFNPLNPPTNNTESSHGQQLLAPANSRTVISRYTGQAIKREASSPSIQVITKTDQKEAVDEIPRPKTPTNGTK